MYECENSWAIEAWARKESKINRPGSESDVRRVVRKILGGGKKMNKQEKKKSGKRKEEEGDEIL